MGQSTPGGGNKATSKEGTLKTLSQKLGFLFKLVTLVYTLDCNVWIYKHKGKQDPQVILL